MSLSSHDRMPAEIIGQTELLRSLIKNADMKTPVPTCPGWCLGQLVRHVGGVHRWVETVAATRAVEPVSDELVDDLDGYTDEVASELDPWLAEGAERLVEALRGTEGPLWTPQGLDTPAFWARRALYETVLHRADAALALGAGFRVDDEVAAEGLEEWLGFSCVPEAYEGHGLLGPGRGLSFNDEWLVDLGGDAPAWRRGRGDASVTVRGPVSELLLFVYRRPAPNVAVSGDSALLELWLERSGFWLEAEDDH
ncbi:maleylpyruvate isomerase family mycothiol-dependent enzyme [Nonomuraea sp. NPDC005650]|uniref:maleylpyruvate isomerase family mycothiol-dependent enzyme n=1 Tax=Nonomuraea sp. NPDC005650 TaxID=3157045 RepID=UPI00339F5FFD